MGLDIVLILAGMVLLIKGGDMLVDGASSLARRFQVSELAIGLTIVAFGTSAPELVVSLSAAVGAHPEIALGNVLGSNNFNLFIILGVTGIVMPVALQKNTVRIEIPFSLLAAGILFILANLAFPFGEASPSAVGIAVTGIADNALAETGLLSRFDGALLLLFFVLFLFYVFKGMKKEAPADGAPQAVSLSLAKSLVFIVLGLGFLVLGGNLVVDSAVALAQALGISEKVIGLTIVAVGTSLPELVTSITAILKKSPDLAVGNIIGSNIFNIFLILGASAAARPMEYSPVFNRDIYVLIAGTLLLLLAMRTGTKRTLDRWEAAILVFLYIGYVIYMVLQNE